MAEITHRIRAYWGRDPGQVELGDKGDGIPAEGEKVELMEGDAYDILGYSFPTWRKWMILSIMFYIQISINLNASLYANGVTAIAEKFHISEQVARHATAEPFLGEYLAASLRICAELWNTLVHILLYSHSKVRIEFVTLMTLAAFEYNCGLS